MVFLVEEQADGLNPFLFVQLESRLILGTGGFRSLESLGEALEASGAEMATLALRRVDPEARGSVVDVLERAGCFLLPNTAGCYTARDAVATAQLAREAFDTDWIKLEVIGDDRTLLPDVGELELVETRAGLRPATPDNGPVVGRGGVDGLLWATGHYRSGILQAPITGEAIAALLGDEEPSAELAPFGPERFALAGRPA